MENKKIYETHEARLQPKQQMMNKPENTLSSRTLNVKHCLLD